MGMQDEAERETEHAVEHQLGDAIECNTELAFLYRVLLNLAIR